MSRSGARVIGAAGLAVAAAAVLLAMRAASALSFSLPPLVVTSGAEEEAIMGVIRAMTGAAYVDTARIPFSATYYNWLFYEVYAGFIGLVGAALGLDIAWATSIGRWLSLIGTVLCGITALACLDRMSPQGGPLARLHNRLLAAWLAMGPLVGYWAISINVEIWATLATMLATLVLLRDYQRFPLRAVAVASLLSLAAWSFKQSYIFIPLALGLFLLIRRDWASMAATVALHLGGVVLILALGSPEYREMMLAWRGSDFALWQLWRNLANVGFKTLPVLVAAALCLAPLRHVRLVVADTRLLLALCGIIATLPLIPAAAKVGAAENYFFPMMFFLALLGGRAVAAWDARGWPGLAGPALTAAWGAEFVACGLVILGVTGSSGVGAMDARYRAQQPCVAGLPAPFYAQDPYLSLPWMHPQGPHFVLAYQYVMERAKGREFERGGVGGLVRDGYFASIALAQGAEARVDGSPLERYTRRPSGCPGLDIYLRRQPDIQAPAF
jgi:hypothetical protein